MKNIILLLLLFFSTPFYAQNDSVSVDKQKDIIKSDFAFTFNGISNNGVIKVRKEQFKKAIIGFHFEDKKMGLKEVTSFSIKIPGIQAEKIIGNKIDDRIYNKILRIASRGDKITIFDIKINENKQRTLEGMCYLSPPLVIEIY